MKNEIDILLTRSIIDSDIYDVPSLNCIYAYSVFFNYCEVEAKNFKDYKFDVDKWEPSFKTSYRSSELDLVSIFPTSASLGISLNLVLANKNKEFPIRFISKRELLKEGLYIKAYNKPPSKVNKYWVKTKLGLISCSYLLTAGIILVFIPQLSVIDLLKLKSNYLLDATK